MAIETVTTIREMRARVGASRRGGALVGLVPTMGALHAGHGALIEAARAGCGFLVVSVFVNPIQFDRREDYDRYARNVAADAAYCERLGADAVFAPAVEEMYPGPQRAFVDVAGVTERLEGEFRPGHFRGVATVVAKLFHIVTPERAWFGEKDAQQLAVIERMVADLDMGVEIVPVATVREADGLALSSRNQRLSAEERAVAPLLYRALDAARSAVEAGCADARAVEAAGMAVLVAEPRFRVEYLAVANPVTMMPVERVDGRVRIAAAAWLGGTRLIDNVAAAPRG